MSKATARPCIGCEGKHYRLATRGDGERAVERCDTCSLYMNDEQALTLSGAEGRAWLQENPNKEREI